MGDIDMMDEAKVAVADLASVEEDDLYTLLALRVKAIEGDHTKAGSFAPAVPGSRELGIAPVDLVAFGRRAFARIAVAGQTLVCGSGAEQGYHLQRLLASMNTDVNTVAAALATLLVGQLALAPAVAGVVATIVVGKVAPASVDALCKSWSAKVSSAPS